MSENLISLNMKKHTD